MNKSRIIACFALLLGALLANAVGAAPSLTIGIAIGNPGQPVTLPVTFNNDSGVASVQFDVQYATSQLIAGTPAAGTALGSNGLASSEITPGIWRIIVTPTPANSAISSGDIVTLPFTIKSSATTGVQTLAISNVVMANATTASVAPGNLQNGIMTIATTGTTVLVGTGGNDTVSGTAQKDVINGSDGNDTLNGQAGDDIILGGSGNDYLTGGDGVDILDGGAGDDTLAGNAGADIYRWNDGEGKDTITRASDIDRLELGPAVTPSNIVLWRTGDYLYVAVTGSSDYIRIQDHFKNGGLDSYALGNLVFTDGTVWDRSAIISHLRRTGDSGDDRLEGVEGADTLSGMGGNDTLYGHGGNDTLIGGDGDDSLYGDAGDDLLQGGNGNDNLYGGDGVDILDGGAGDDTLAGNAGADIYRWNDGEGKDTITRASDIDRLELGTAVTTGNIVLQKIGTYLYVSISGSNDYIRIQDHFKNGGLDSYALGSLVFSNGTVWDRATIISHLQ